MRGLGWFMLVLLGLLAPAPAAAQTRDEKACLHPPSDRNTIAACNRFIEDVSRKIEPVALSKDKDGSLYRRYNQRGGAYQAIARRHAANEEPKKAGELHLRAIGEFDKAIHLDPASPHAFINRGGSWAELVFPDRAIQDFEQVLRIAPKNALAYNNRGGAYRDKGNDDRAMADLNRALELKQNFAYAFFNRGTVHLQKENYDRAIADYTAAMRHGPKDIDTLAARGRAWRDKGGNDKQARADFEAALALPAEDKRSKSVQDAVRELLRALQEKADREKAERERRQKTEREEAERERLEKAEREAAERERAALEKAEKAARERAEQAARERAELEKAARERAERERVARERAEREKATREKIALEKAARQSAERERIERERAERERAARARVEKAARERAERAAREKAERERIEREKEKRKNAEREKARANRIALVIGNSAYRKLGWLPNPRNDAEAIAKVLDALDFTVFRGINLTHAEMAEMLARFAHAARDAETALFFFGGHGQQDAGVNYLAPIDADERDLGKFVTLQSVMDDIKSERGVRILIIDACRNRPAAQEVASLQPLATRSAFVERGLAMVDRRDVPTGMFIAYAAQPGQVASDGVGLNSPFARGLLKHLPTPGLELRHLFIRVRSEVLADTGTQRPHVDDSLDGEFFFKAPQ